jgi:hypothetical protein
VQSSRRVVHHALLIWLAVDPERPQDLRARLTTTHGLEPGTYSRTTAATPEEVCKEVRKWLEIVAPPRP